MGLATYLWRYLLKYTHVIWDFNGTILDDVEIGIESVNLMLSARGLKTLDSVEAYREAFGFPIIDYYRALGFDFEKEDYHTVLAPEWVNNYLERIPRTRAFDGVKETMTAIRQLGLIQVLLSASEVNQLTGQLCGLGLGLEDYLSEIVGLDNIHAGSKKDNALFWKARNPDAVPLFIGDTEHDAEVARAIGADCVLFSGGHQPRALLEGLGCPVIDSIPKLLDFVK
ncbi:MAG: HAD family hydrolase [Ruminococcaceae bacterium]|nr:HAD family hydrolase [Oscillospiraceae bacterium]